MSRFVVLHHFGIDSPHFDLMLELPDGSALATWRIDRWPIVEPVEAKRLRDHRPFYLTHQGPVPGNRGQVLRVDEGTWEGSGTSSEWNVRLNRTASTASILITHVEQDIWILKNL